LPQPAPLPETQERSAVSLLKTSDSTRLVLYFSLAVIVGAALAYALWVYEAPPAVAVLAAAAAALVVFSAFYGFDMFILSGYAHRRLEVHASTYLAETARDTNLVQAEQIEQIWDFVFELEERINGLATIEVHDHTGTRRVPRVDPIDGMIRRWLTSNVFDPNGLLSGVHPTGQLKNAYPFKGNSDDAQAAHARLTAAGLVGKNGNNYTWTGPQTLSDTLLKVTRFVGRDVPEVEE
jgi:hypothetical protein